LRDCIVGRTRYCLHPAGIESTPIVPTLNRANVESLLALEPDIVLVFGRAPTLAQKLADAGIRFEALPDKSLSAIFAAIRRVGSLTGRTRTASALCRAIEAELAAVTAEYHATVDRRVLLLTSTLESPPRPPFVAGPGSYYDALLRRSGFVNVVANERQAYAPLSLEFITRADPDVIVELDPDGRARPHGDADALSAWRRVGPLRAVRNGRVHALVGPEYYVPGPRIAGTYAELCRVISGT